MKIKSSNLGQIASIPALFSFVFLVLAALWPYAAKSAEGDIREIKLGTGATQYQLLQSFPAAGTKCLRYLDGADGTTIGKQVGCFKIGPQFVVDGNGFLTVPVTQGPPGSMGATGNTGATGADGSQGPVGRSAYELAQVDGFTGTLQSWLLSLKGAQGIQGVPGNQGPVGPAGTANIQRLRATTAADGTFTWTFPTPYPAGTLPVISVTPEGTGTVSYQHTVTAISNTGFSVRVIPIADVTLLGIRVLGIQTQQAATIHLIATAP